MIDQKTDTDRLMWCAMRTDRNGTGQFIGFMITELNPQLPIAFVGFNPDILEAVKTQESAEMEWNLLAVALALRDGRELEYTHSHIWSDLRHVGRFDSMIPVPGWLYGLRLHPRQDDHCDSTLEINWREPALCEMVVMDPYCPVRLRQTQGMRRKLIRQPGIRLTAG